MFAEGVGSLAVLVAGSLEGIVTERDITRAAADGVDFEEATVGEYMSSPADSIGPDADVTEAAEWLLATGYRHLPIVDDGRLVGIASIKDVLWAVAEAKSTKQ
jgi:CBS domain-containing protein